MLSRIVIISIVLGLLIFALFNIYGINIEMKSQTNPQKAIVVYPEHGYVTFTQNPLDKSVTVRANLHHLPPNRQLGWHIHQYGDIRTAKAVGPHYNPHQKKHGGPYDQERHVGDLGNLKTNAKGESRTSVTIKGLKLDGKYSVLGRALVIHHQKDDLGRGGTDESETTGCSGGRMLYGVIGRL